MTRKRRHRPAKPRTLSEPTITIRSDDDGLSGEK